jgi:hypothetical protein
MQIRTQELFQKLEALSAHYKTNVASPYVKPEFGSLALSRRDWDEIELITVRQELFRHQGYHLDELYLKLLALARFVKAARTQWGSNFKNMMSTRHGGRSPNERIMADMVAANFPANLTALAAMVVELFELVRNEDRAQNGGKTKGLSSVPEAKEIPALLDLVSIV